MKAALAFRVQAIASRRLSSCVGFFFFWARKRQSEWGGGRKRVKGKNGSRGRRGERERFFCEICFAGTSYLRRTVAFAVQCGRRRWWIYRCRHQRRRKASVTLAALFTWSRSAPTRTPRHPPSHPPSHQPSSGATVWNQALLPRTPPPP